MLVLLLALVVRFPWRPDDVHRLRDDVLWSAAGAANWHCHRRHVVFRRIGAPLIRTCGRSRLNAVLVVCDLVAWLLRRAGARLLAVAGASGCRGGDGALYQGPDPSRAYFGSDTRAAPARGRPAGAGLSRRCASRSRFSAAAWAPVLAALAAVALTALASRRPGVALLYPLGFLATEAATMVPSSWRCGRGGAGRCRAPGGGGWAAARLWHTIHCPRPCYRPASTHRGFPWVVRRLTRTRGPVGPALPAG